MMIPLNVLKRAPEYSLFSSEIIIEFHSSLSDTFSFTNNS